MSIWAIAILSLIGFGASVHLSSLFYSLRGGTGSFKSFCNINETFNCDAVSASPYAELAFGLPLSSFAAGWYVAIFAVCLFALSGGWRREGKRALALMTGFGVTMSLIWLYIMAAKLQVYCIECLIIDFVNVASFVLALTLRPERAGATDTGQWKTFAGVTAASLFVSIIFLKSMQTTRMPPGREDEIVNDILASPVLPVSSGPEFPSFGPANAPVTIVEFLDFQCPTCRMGARTLKTVMARYPEKVRVVVRNFPLDPACNPKMQLSGHPQACAAAKVVACAGKQGHFAAAYQEIFERQDDLKTVAPAEMIKALSGIDTAQLDACVASPEIAQAITRDLTEGEQLGVQGTPSFFVNGKKVRGLLTVDGWAKLVDRIAP